MIFYLQQHEPGGRLLIDSTFPWNAHRVVDSCDAFSWLEAKNVFGYELSDVQARLLEKQKEDRWAACSDCTDAY